METYDLLIVGGGGAGLTAGIYASRCGLKAIVLDEGMGGGQAATAPLIENFPGFGSISGSELMEKMSDHAKRYLKVETTSLVTGISKGDAGFTVSTSKGDYQGKAVLIATGAIYRKC